MPLSPPTILVISLTDGRGANNPLHVVLGDSPYVTANFTHGMYIAMSCLLYIVGRVVEYSCIISC